MSTPTPPAQPTTTNRRYARASSLVFAVGLALISLPVFAVSGGWLGAAYGALVLFAAGHVVHLLTGSLRSGAGRVALLAVLVPTVALLLAVAPFSLWGESFFLALSFAMTSFGIAAVLLTAFWSALYLWFVKPC